MYKKKIEQYIEAHKQEMLDDICTLCSINSERSAYQEGDPFGEGPSRGTGTGTQNGGRVWIFHQQLR